MELSDSIRRRIGNAERQAESLRQRIRDLEEQYESLCRFIPEIEQSRSSVSGMVNQRKAILASLDGIKQNCDPAAAYLKSATHNLTGIGSNVVVLAMTALSGMARAKLVAIRSAISVAEADLSVLQVSISVMGEELRAAEQADRLISSVF